MGLRLEGHRERCSQTPCRFLVGSGSECLDDTTGRGIASLSPWSARLVMALVPHVFSESFSETSVGCVPRVYPPQQGFDTTFTFRISSPSIRCNIMDGVHTHCRSRGADGLAFVIQAEGPTSLGEGGMVSERGRSEVVKYLKYLRSTLSGGTDTQAERCIST